MIHINNWDKFKYVNHKDKQSNLIKHLITFTC